MKDVRTGDRELLPLVFQGILSMERAIVPMKILDPNGYVVKAWDHLSAMVEIYASTCADAAPASPAQDTEGEQG